MIYTVPKQLAIPSMAMGSLLAEIDVYWLNEIIMELLFVCVIES